jgi:exopolysaccharide biosynthesis predicted pyruvyltransferase EpsI
MSLLPRHLHHLHHLHHLFIICHLAYLPDMVLMLPEICRIQEKESYERDVIHGCALASHYAQPATLATAQLRSAGAAGAEALVS